MANRLAFTDFVSGLLHLDPALRWSPQQARLHPFVLGEPLLQPFVPPPNLKTHRNSVSSGSNLPSGNAMGGGGDKRYGGLQPAVGVQRGQTRTYENAAYVSFPSLPGWRFTVLMSDVGRTINI